MSSSSKIFKVILFLTKSKRRWILWTKLVFWYSLSDKIYMIFFSCFAAERYREPAAAGGAAAERGAAPAARADHPRAADHRPPAAAPTAPTGKSTKMSDKGNLFLKSSRDYANLRASQKFTNKIAFVYFSIIHTHYFLNA